MQHTDSPCLDTVRNVENVNPSDLPIPSFCRNTLSEVLCLLWCLPHRLLWLPAVLHREAELSLHLLLQHPALQRAKEEAPRLVGSDAKLTDEPASSPPPDLFPAATDAPPADVDGPTIFPLYSLSSLVQTIEKKETSLCCICFWFIQAPSQN